QARHQDVAEDDVRSVIRELRERIEPVLGQHDVAAGLLEEDLRAAPDGVAVVDDHHLEARDRFDTAHEVILAHSATSSQIRSKIFIKNEAHATQISATSKSSFRAPHSGQVQFGGMSAQRVPGAIPSS